MLLIGLVFGVSEAQGQSPTSSVIYGQPRRRARPKPKPRRAAPGKPARPNKGATKPGAGATKPGAGATKPGAGMTKPGAGATKPPPAQPDKPGARPPAARTGGTPDARRGPPKQPPPRKRPPARAEPRRNLMPWGKPRPDSRPEAGTAVQPKAGGGPARPGDPRSPGERPAEMDPSSAPGLGYTIVGVRIIGNKKTKRGTVLVYAKVPIGKPFTLQVRDRIRRNLLSGPFCKDVTVNWEVATDKPNSVILFLTLKEKISWMIMPMFSYSDGNIGGSLAFTEKNLGGTGKQLRVKVAYSNESQELILRFRDPNILYSPWIWGIQLSYERADLKEYDPSKQGIRDATLLRSQTFQLFGTRLELGYRWYDWVTTTIRYQFGLVDYARPECLRSSPGENAEYQRCPPLDPALDPAALGQSYYVGPMAVQEDGLWRDSIDQKGRFWKWARDAFVHLDVSLSRTHNVYGMRSGFDLNANLFIAHKNLGGSFSYVTWEARYFHGFNFGRSRKFGARHNLTLEFLHAQTYNAPYYRELRTGGSALRGYISQQFVGDTLTNLRVQYKVHMFSLAWLYFRAVVFYDMAWIFFRNGGGADAFMEEHDQELRRYFLPNTPGPRSRTAVNNGIGVGLRFYIKGLSAGALGFDVAYGIEAKAVRFLVTLGG
ncbi:MAG: BamA/TamA family outer membrane protein [bacterium]